MWPLLVRNILFPAHEALLRRPTLPILRQLAAETARSDDYIMRYQAQQIAALVQHARAAVPYWRDKSRLGNPPPTSGHPLPQNTLPILTRAEIHLHREAMRWPDAPGKLIRHTSSGTTDDNLIFYLDRQRQAWDRALRIRALARLGVQVGEKQLHFWPKFDAGGSLGFLKDTARLVRDRLFNEPVFELRPLTSERMDAALAFLDKYRPGIIVGYPSWLFALAQRRLLNSRGGHATLMPRYILSTGELLYDFQRQAIESAFGARVVEEYGLHDVGLIASEDAAGSWVVNWQHIVVEVLRDGRPARPGEMGEIVVTNLHSHVMPFIRYATGDIVTVPSAAGAIAPAGPPTLMRIEGRASDVLVTTDGRLHSNRELVDALVRDTGVTEFSLHQTAPDRILCMTIRDGGWIGQEGRVTELLRSMLGRSLQVSWKIGGAFRPLKSSKRRYVCSPVAQTLLAHDRESGMFLSRAWPQRVLDAA